jgi:hypothetical protein
MQEFGGIMHDVKVVMDHDLGALVQPDEHGH